MTRQNLANIIQADVFSISNLTDANAALAITGDTSGALAGAVMPEV